MTGKVGVLGGMGPLATHAFFGHLIAATAACGDADHISVVIASEPSIPDRTEFLLGLGPDPRPALVAVARTLSGAGASFGVIPCNTANVFVDEIESQSGLPFVRWIDVAVAEAVRLGRSPIGLLATSGTIRSNVYQHAFEREGIPFVLPGEDEQRTIMDAVYGPNGVKGGGDGQRGRLAAVAQQLDQRGARAFILACTELPLALPPASKMWPHPTIDPSVAVARASVIRAGGRVIETT